MNKTTYLFTQFTSLHNLSHLSTHHSPHHSMMMIHTIEIGKWWLGEESLKDSTVYCTISFYPHFLLTLNHSGSIVFMGGVMDTYIPQLHPTDDDVDLWQSCTPTSHLIFVFNLWDLLCVCVLDLAWLFFSDGWRKYGYKNPLGRLMIFW